MFRVILVTLSVLFAALALLGPGPSGPASRIAGLGSAGLLSDPRAFHAFHPAMDQPVRVARDVRVWAEPTLQSPVVGLLKSGDEIRVLQEVRPGWATVMLPERVGYIPARAARQVTD